MLENESFTDIRDFLKGCVRTLKKQSPHLSSSQLAKKLGMTPSTFSRLENGDTERPTFNNALKIVKEICTDENIIDFVERFYPDMSKNYSRVYRGNQEAKFLPTEVETFFENSNSYEIMLMATSAHGLTRQTVSDEFGKRGLITLENLISKGVLKEEQGRFSIQKKINATQETVQKLLQNLLSLSYDVEAFGEKDNWLTLQYESLNADLVLPELVNIYTETNQKIRELFSDPKNKGTEVVWAALVGDTLLKSGRNQFTKEVIQ